jgi:RNA polymerase sigma-70 factor (ECF subfamily)
MTIATYLFSNSMERETEELARGLRRRDPDLLDRLIEQYHYRLFRYLLYLTGSRGLLPGNVGSGDRPRPPVQGQVQVRDLALTIARNLVIDCHRRKTRESLDAFVKPDKGQQALEPSTPVNLSPAELAAAHEESDRVAAALARLSATYREVLLLRFQEELRLDEIAAVVSAPLSTVKSRLYRGLGELREMLAGETA